MTLGFQTGFPPRRWGWLLALGIFFAACRPSSQRVALRVSPKTPQPGQTLTLSWNQPLTGYLWIMTYVGPTAFQKTVEIVPIHQQSEASYTPPSQAYLLLVALEDTVQKAIYTGPEYAIVLYQSDGRPMPHAFAVLGNTYYRTDLDSLRAYLAREKASGSSGCLFQNAVWNLSLQAGEITADSVRRILDSQYPPQETLAPECLYMAFRTAYFVLHDSALAEQYIDALLTQENALAQWYGTRARLQTWAFVPTGDLRDRISTAYTLWDAFQKDSVVRSIVLGDDFFRWLLPYAWISQDRRRDFYRYIQERKMQEDLQANDLVTMRYIGLGWMGEPDTTLLQYVLMQEKALLDDPILYRKQFALSNWDRLSDFYRLYDRSQGDYLKSSAQLWLFKNKPAVAYNFIHAFVQKKPSLFALWQEDLQLYGEAALGAGHLDEAEQAFALIAFFHGDTSAYESLRKVWEQKGKPDSFDLYLVQLKQEIEKTFPPAPPFTGKTLNGQTVRLSDYSGKVVVLNFWATWCGPCRREIPELNELVKEFQGNPEVVFLAITDEPAEVVQRFLKQQPFAYRILVDGRAIRQAYKANAFPTHFVISRDGRLVFKQVGYIPGTADRLKSQILKFLGTGEAS